MYRYVSSLLPSDEPRRNTVSTFERFLFHGVAYRGKVNTIGAAPRYLGDADGPSLRLLHAVHILPPAISPSSIVLLIAPIVAGSLSNVQNVALSKVPSVSLRQWPIDISPAEWQRWYETLKKERDFLDPVHLMPEAKGKCEYIELVVPRYERIVEKSGPQRVCRFRRFMLSEDEETTISISREMEAAYPVFFKGGYFFRDDVFERMKAADPLIFDSAHFDVREVRHQK